jgi:Exopolysaccharide synthesis, ExoD
MTNENNSKSQLSADLEMLHAQVKGKSLTLAELKQALKGRGSAMLMILLALPFCFITIPGLSTAIATWAFIGLTSVFAVGGFQRVLDFFLARCRSISVSTSQPAMWCSEIRFAASKIRRL